MGQNHKTNKCKRRVLCFYICLLLFSLIFASDSDCEPRWHLFSASRNKWTPMLPTTKIRCENQRLPPPYISLLEHQMEERKISYQPIFCFVTFRNQWIHIICVPIIFWTALVFVNKFVPAFFETDLGFGLLPYGPFVINGSFVGTTLFVLFYIILEPLAGVLNPFSPSNSFSMPINPFCFFLQILYAPILYGLCYTATHFTNTNPNAVSIALVIHVVSWILQVTWDKWLSINLHSGFVLMWWFLP